jgi:hypothetical protein
MSELAEVRGETIIGAIVETKLGGAQVLRGR